MDQDLPKTGVVFYSRSGHSKRIASKLAQALHSDLLEIGAPAYANGVFGYMRAGFDSLMQNHHLAPQAFTSLAGFDRIILCGPVWTSFPATPLRALLKGDIDLPDTVALFLTNAAHSPPAKAYAAGSKDLGRSFAATACVANSLEDTEQEGRIVERFLKDLAEVQTSSVAN